MRNKTIALRVYMNILKCISSFSIIIISFSIFAPAFGKIHKKVHSDGTIEYYNNLEYAPKTDSGETQPANQSKLTSVYDDLINVIAREEGIDPYLVKCIIKIESNFNPDAVSVAGAMGLMQLMLDTSRLYNVHDPLNPEENIRTGVKHFKSLFNNFKGDIPLALAAYHAGLGTVKKANNTIPPIKATMEYVNNIMALYQGYNSPKKNYSSSVVKLHQKIDKDGDILIYSK